MQKSIIVGKRAAGLGDLRDRDAIVLALARTKLDGGFISKV